MRMVAQPMDDFFGPDIASLLLAGKGWVND